MKTYKRAEDAMLLATISFWLLVVTSAVFAAN